MSLPLRPSRRFHPALLAGVAGLLATSAALAQDAAAAAPQTKSLIDVYVLGGWAMWPLTLFSIVGVGLFFYNLVTIKPKAFLQTDLVARLTPVLEQLDLEQAKSLCAAAPGPVSNTFAAGLDRVELDDFDPAALEKAMEEASSVELAQPFVYINYLSTIANISPMVGLLGTVSGMIKAFDTIAKEGMGKPELLANNISEALITTAAGLIVAIPAMIAYLWFKNRYGKIASGVGEVVGDLEHTLVRAVKRAARGQA